MADLVRVRDKFQVTIPARVREKVPLREGDYVEVMAVPEGILLKSPSRAGRAAGPKTIREYLRARRSGGLTKSQIDERVESLRDEWS